MIALETASDIKAIIDAMTPVEFQRFLVVSMKESGATKLTVTSYIDGTNKKNYVMTFVRR